MVDFRKSHNSLTIRTLYSLPYLLYNLNKFCRTVFNANSVDPDKTPRSVVSDLDLHCLPVTDLVVTRLKWVNI